MKKSEFKVYREMLVSLKHRLRGDVEQLTNAALSRNEGSADGKNPTHLAELGTDAYEQDFSLWSAEKDQEILEEVAAALKKIEAGTFGLCELCQEDGKPPSRSKIAKTRLRALPYARNCIHCERKREELAL